MHLSQNLSSAVNVIQMPLYAIYGCLHARVYVSQDTYRDLYRKRDKLIVEHSCGYPIPASIAGFWRDKYDE
jgi:hypothetical protein